MRKHPLRFLIYPLVGLLAWALYGVMRIVPVSVASGFCGRVTRMIGPLLPVAKVAERNLATFMPELSAEQRQAIALQVWENLGRVAGEFAHMSDLTVKNGRVKLKGGEFFTAAATKDTPSIFFSGHFANWEVFAAAAAEAGTPVSLVYRRANNPFVDYLYRFARRRITSRLFSKNREGARALLKAMREPGHTVGILVDQKMNDGIAVPFFGRPAMTAPAIAEMALRYHAPIHPARIRRYDGAHFEVEIFPPMDIHEDDTALSIMTRINAQLEEWIREDPGQWLWLHKRWGKSL